MGCTPGLLGSGPSGWGLPNPWEDPPSPTPAQGGSQTKGFLWRKHSWAIIEKNFGRGRRDTLVEPLAREGLCCRKCLFGKNKCCRQNSGFLGDFKSRVEFLAKKREPHPRIAKSLTGMASTGCSCCKLQLWPESSSPLGRAHQPSSCPRRGHRDIGYPACIPWWFCPVWDCVERQESISFCLGHADSSHSAGVA